MKAIVRVCLILAMSTLMFASSAQQADVGEQMSPFGPLTTRAGKSPL